MSVPYIYANTPFNTNLPLSTLDANFAYLLGAMPAFKMEALTISTTNIIPALTYTPAFQTGVSGGVFVLVVNGIVVAPVGSPTPFSVVGNTVTWTSSTSSVYPGDVVVAIYNH